MAATPGGRGVTGNAAAPTKQRTATRGHQADDGQPGERKQAEHTNNAGSRRAGSPRPGWHRCCRWRRRPRCGGRGGRAATASAVDTTVTCHLGVHFTQVYRIPQKIMTFSGPVFGRCSKNECRHSWWPTPLPIDRRRLVTFQFRASLGRRARVSRSRPTLSTAPFVIVATLNAAGSSTAGSRRHHGPQRSRSARRAPAVCAP